MFKKYNVIYNIKLHSIIVLPTMALLTRSYKSHFMNILYFTRFMCSGFYN